jgi:hypothetical protein
MKNIMKYILIFVIGGLVMSSCENIETNWDTMTNDYDKNSTTYYIQFLNATASYETEIDEAGLPTNITTTVGVALLGPPQASAVTVTLVPDASSTLASNMYTLSSNTITIPAGQTSGSVSLTAIAEEMPEDETLHLVLNMDAGGAEASSAFQLDYAMKRIKFCPLDDLNDLAGNWSGMDDWGNSEKMTTSVMDGKFMLIDLGKVWLSDVWGEVTLEMNEVEVTMNPNGTLVIEEQPYCTTEYDGAPYDYSIVGSGTWDNCKKIMIISYDLNNTTDGYYLSDYGYAPIVVNLEMN